MGADPLRVAVVGGGIGGMAAAIALRDKGLGVNVYEQAPHLGEIGAGVLMTPNGVRVLEGLGMGPALSEVGAPIRDGSSYYRMDGTAVGPIVTTDSHGWNGMYGMHRADLLSVLADALPADLLHTDHCCTSFSQDDDAARLTFSNGEMVEADVVIGADGIHSTLRHHVAEPAQPVYSGSVAYRGLIPAEDLPEWPRDISQLWMGEGKHFLVYPVRSGRMINYVGFVPRDAQTLESWSAPGDPAALAEEFRGWDPRVEQLLARVRTTFWWGLYDREPMPRWTRGRLSLLGDAAHPMLPHLGQGANQSIEDGAALAEFLADADTDRNNVTAALTAYEHLRRERTTQVQVNARANGRRYDSAYEDLAARDAEIVSTATFRLWLYDHDAAGAARAARDAGGGAPEQRCIADLPHRRDGSERSG